MFNAMKDGIREDTVGFLFNLQVQVEEEGSEDEFDEDELADAIHVHEQHPIIHAKGLSKPQTPTGLTYSAPTEGGEAEVRGATGTVTNADDPYAKVGRNQKCPCGSGKKFKQCHGAAGPTGLTTRAGG